VPKADVGDLATWERVRQQVRETRQARGLTMRQLAEQLGLALSTLEAALQTRRPPSRAMRARLEAWLAAAPEVAAEAFPFRGTGTSRGHTAGRGATARNGAGADRHEAA
jgi:transcriptional regulator with XRE-family HTH domain